MYKTGFGNNIEGITENNFFKFPFGNREETIELLKQYSDEIATILIGIDGTNFSTNIKTMNISNPDFLYSFDYDVNFLEKGTDGVILTGLKNLNSEIKLYKKSIGIILGVGDCAPIIGASNDGNTIFNLHGGYKGILGLDNDNHGLIYNFKKDLDKNFIKADNISLDIGPMAGADFELDENYIKPLIENFLHNYKKLNISDYYTKTIIKDDKQKGNINLRQLILDVLKYHGIKNVSYTKINTTDENNWPSYRRFVKGLQVENNRLSSTIRKRVS